jgi:hypothetical protein
MSDPEFDALVDRVRALDIAYRSTPQGPADLHVDAQHGALMVYWSVPDGHGWDALTRQLSWRQQMSDPSERGRPFNRPR